MILKLINDGKTRCKKKYKSLSEYSVMKSDEKIINNTFILKVFVISNCVIDILMVEMNL